MTQVSMMAVRALLAALERAGVERGRFLAEAGVSESQLADPHARLTFEDYSRARVAALVTSGDPAFGLHMGEQLAIGTYDVLGYLAEHSSCLREALRVAVRYARIVMEGPRLALDEDGDTATVRFTMLCGEAPEVRLTAEFVTSAIQHVVRRFVGSDAQPRRVFFAYGAPAHRAEYTRIFGGRERFSHPFTGVELERAWLDRSHGYRSPELCALLHARAELLLARVEQDAPAAERVSRWLVAQDLDGRPTMDAVARALGMSARSLRRRLHGEGSEYGELLEQARALRAKHMLANPRCSVQETAYSLGFNTPAAFSRAFKRWTGMAPSAYRNAR